MGHVLHDVVEDFLVVVRSFDFYLSVLSYQMVLRRDALTSYIYVWHVFCMSDVVMFAFL